MSSPAPCVTCALLCAPARPSACVSSARTAVRHGYIPACAAPRESAAPPWWYRSRWVPGGLPRQASLRALPAPHRTSLRPTARTPWCSTWSFSSSSCGWSARVAPAHCTYLPSSPLDLSLSAPPGRNAYGDDIATMHGRSDSLCRTAQAAYLKIKFAYMYSTSTSAKLGECSPGWVCCRSATSLRVREPRLPPARRRQRGPRRS